MVPVVIECEFPGCGAKKEAESAAVALGMMQLHQANVHPVVQKQKPPKIDRPRTVRGSSREEWATFVRRWELFIAGTAGMTATECSCQLIACCDQDLETCLFQYNPEVESKGEAGVLSAIKALAVVDVAATV